MMQVLWCTVVPVLTLYDARVTCQAVALSNAASALCKLTLLVAALIRFLRVDTRQATNDQENCTLICAPLPTLHGVGHLHKSAKLQTCTYACACTAVPELVKPVGMSVQMINIRLDEPVPLVVCMAGDGFRPKELVLPVAASATPSCQRTAKRNMPPNIFCTKRCRCIR